MKIIKLSPTHIPRKHHRIALNSSAGLIVGVLSFGCVDASAERLVNTIGNAGICTRGLYNDETIKMNVANTAGIKIGDGGPISLARGTIKNNALSAANAKDQIGIYVFSASSVGLLETEVTLDPKTAAGATIIASDMTAALVESAGQLSLKDSTVTVGGGAKGNNNRGIVVTGADSQASLDNSKVQTSSWGSVGIAVTQGGKATLSSASEILTNGARNTTTGGSHGVYVSGKDSELNAKNSKITTLGASAYAVKAQDGGQIALIETAIETAGVYGHGVLLDGDTTQGDIGGGSIQTTGKGATGIWARNGATVTLHDGAAINTSGAAVSVAAPLDNEMSLSLSHVLLASDGATSISGKDLQLTTTAASASVARAENKAGIILRDSTIDSSGAATSTTTTAALHALSGAAITGSGLTVNVSGTNQGGSRAEGENSSIALTNSTLTVSGQGNALHSSSAARAISGASVSVINSQMTTSGMQSHGISVEGAGSDAQVSGTTIETRGARSSAVNIVDGASARISSSKMTTTAGPNVNGPWSHGIMLQGAGSSLILTDSEVITTQNPSSGISALNGSQLEVNTSRISTSGNYGSGIGVANSTASITDTHINTSGNDNAMGIVADAGAVVKVTGGSVTTTGNGSPVSSNLTFPHAVASRNAGSFLTVDGTTLLTKGTQAYGATADDGGNIVLKNTTVKTEGDNSIGLYAGIGAAKPGNVSLSASNVTIETLGDNAAGAFVGRKYKAETAEMALDNVSLNTHGDNSRGIWAEAGAELQAKNTVIQTDGVRAAGIFASNGGHVRGDNISVTTHGENAAALGAQGTSANPGLAAINNSLLASERGHGIETTGHADITLQNTRVSSDSQWLQVRNSAMLPGNAHISASGSLLTGAALTEANAYSDVALNNTTLWFLTGNSVLSQLTNNQSLINFSTPDSNQYKTLTVNNYHGDNGTIALNTHLHSDNSPSDQLVVDGGHADGSTNLKITNTDGSGALTHGNGIKVVDAISGATTAIEAFSLLNKVKAGPYEYSLYRSSVDGNNQEAWYLRSHSDVPREIEQPEPPLPPAPPAPTPGETPDITPPEMPGATVPETPDETPENGASVPSIPQPPVAVPDYRAETSLYQDIPQLALLYSRMLVDSLHERTGEQFASVEKITAATESPHMSWGRLIFKNGKSDFDGPQSRFTLNAIQLGIDLYRESKNDGSSDFAGVLGNIGKINSKVTHTDSEYAGRNTLKSWGLGGYWTHFTPEGSYLDAVAQYNRLYVESRPTDLSPMKTKGYGLSASLEAGYPWQPDTDVQRFIEPQAQLIYSTVKLDNTHDQASTIKFSNTDSLTGRLSLRFHQTWHHDDEHKVKEDRTRTTAWLRPGILHEFRGETKTSFSSQQGDIPFVTNSAGTWGQLNAGVDHQINKSVSIAGSLSVEKSFEGDSINYGGIVGLKIKF
ncbi:autotransporter outer membrane beta-barrel domain-containing protein [Buttiauxella sp.]|uniref:autotransporter outer membrane beta-barrel domain-containing protein n=1 Tax=Buttiauxella sp. TaxID=1972222 RepID=UPI003C7148BD